MKLSLSQIRYVAKLANLSFPSDEIRRFTRDLSAILRYVEQISQVAVSRFKPLSQVNNLWNIWRADEEIASQQLSHAEAIQSARQTWQGFFKVRRIIRQNK